MISREDIWYFPTREQFEEWCRLAEESRRSQPILQGLTLREIITAQRYEFLDARALMQDG